MVALALGVVSCRDRSKKATPPEPIPVTVQVIEPIASMPDTFELDADVESNRVVKVSAEVPGRIERYGEAVDADGKALGREWQEGDLVRKGAPLVYLNKDLIEAEYALPYLAHATMEPMNCTVAPREGGCDVYLGSQSPGLVQDVVAAELGLAREDVVVHNQLLGGGFGGLAAGGGFGAVKADGGGALWRGGEHVRRADDLHCRRQLERRGDRRSRRRRQSRPHCGEQFQQRRVDPAG